MAPNFNPNKKTVGKGYSIRQLIKTLFGIMLLAGVFLSQLVVAYADTTTRIDASPYPYVNYGYSSSVKTGTIRYMSQISGSSYFNSDYWGDWTWKRIPDVYYGPGYECGTCSMSMALSYIGINKTPDDILSANNGVTYWTGWGVDHSQPSINDGISRYIDGNGKYSPLVIKLPHGGSGDNDHFVAIVGKSGSTLTILDPAIDSIMTATISGSNVTYRSSTYYVSETHQWYNSSAQIIPPSYLDRCTVYPTNLTVKTTKGTYLKKLPCAYNTDNNSTNVVSSALPTGTSFTVTEMYRNDYDHYNTCWYKVIYQGKEGYIISEDTKITSYNANDVSISGGTPFPTTIASNSGYYVTNVLTSSHLVIDTIKGCIYDRNGNAVSAYSGNSEKTGIDAKTYQLGSEGRDEPVDGNLLFGKLPAGNYTCQIKVKCLYYYGASDSSLQVKDAGWITPISFSFTKEGNVAAYLDKCTPYPTNLTVKVTNSSTYLKSLPCSKNTDPNSVNVFSSAMPVGATLAVTKLYLNDQGNCWYQTVYNGKEGYIYSGDTEVTSYKTNTISKSGGTTPPTSLSKESGYYVSWLVESDYLNIDTIQGYIYNSDGKALSGYPSEKSGINAKSYQLGCEYGYEAVDSGLHFSTLDPGNYTCTIKVKCLYYYGASDASLQSRTEWKDLVSFSFSKQGETSGTVVMTADQFVGYLQTALSRTTSYDNSYPYNLGYYNGSSISWDCWNLGKSILWSRGSIVNNYTVGNHASIDTSFGLGDWDGLTIIQKAPNCSSNFSSLVPGEWLYLDGHTGYYIGNGQVIECTTSWGVNGVTQSQISSTGARSRNGSSEGNWLYHGMVPWIDYSSYTGISHTHDWVFQYYWAAHPHYNSYKCSICGEEWVDRDSSNYFTNCDDCRPGKPAFTGMSETYDIGSPVTFAWNLTEHTTHYNFYLYKENAAGEYTVIERVMGNDTTLDNPTKRTLEAGKYKALLQAYDNQHWLSDHSDWAYTESDPIFFEIRSVVEYTVSYDANRGTGAPGMQTAHAGESITLSTVEPTLNGYTFIGWSTDSTAVEAEYKAGSSLTPTDNVTLYAVWKEGYYSDWSETKPEGVDNSLIDTRTQYRYRDKETMNSTESAIDGWVLESSEQRWSDYGPWSDWDTDEVTASDSCQVETTPLYLYYYFLCPQCGRHEPFTGTSDCGQYTLSGSDWNETWSTIPYSDCSYGTFSYTTKKYYTTSLGDGQVWCFSSGNLYDTAIGTKDTTSDGIVIKQGYRCRTRALEMFNVFYRWSDWSEWSNNEVSASNTREVDTRIMYRYLIKDYAISFNANGGTGAPEAQTKTHGQPLTLSSTVPTRAGYTFLGWAESADATAAAYQPGGEFVKNADTPLYAVWQKNAPDFTLPAALKEIGEEAFADCAFSYVHIPDGVTRIERRAFADCPNLRDVDIPESATSIDPTAFSGTSGLTIHSADGSYAEFFASKYGFDFVPVA